MDNMEPKGCMSVNYWLVCSEWTLSWKVTNRVECELTLSGGSPSFHVPSDGTVGVASTRSMREHNSRRILVARRLNPEVDFYHIEVSGCHLNRPNFVRRWKTAILNRLHTHASRSPPTWLRASMRYTKALPGSTSTLDNQNKKDDVACHPRQQFPGRLPVEMIRDRHNARAGGTILHTTQPLSFY